MIYIRLHEVNQEPITSDKIVFDSDSDQLQDILLLLNEYHDHFAKNLRVGCTHLAEVKQDMKDNEPVVYRPYRLSDHERAQVRDLVNDLKKANIVEDSTSPTRAQ